MGGAGLAIDVDAWDADDAGSGSDETWNQAGGVAADVNELRRLEARFSTPPRDFKRTPHPFFGEMSERDWMKWGWLHMDHHLRQFGV